jgi:hypothetical protein
MVKGPSVKAAPTPCTLWHALPLNLHQCTRLPRVSFPIHLKMLWYQIVASSYWAGSSDAGKDESSKQWKFPLYGGGVITFYSTLYLRCVDGTYVWTRPLVDHNWTSNDPADYCYAHLYPCVCTLLITNIIWVCTTWLVGSSVSHFYTN